nr:plasmid replication initiator TrfA [Acidovorax sp.]
MLALRTVTYCTENEETPTHKEPYPLKLETFRLMCGSDSTRPKKWREQVGEACDELRENGLVESAWVNDDLVHCKR